MMYAAVSGGTGEIMSLSIFSDAEDNSSGERLVLANLSTQGGSLAHGLYSYNHTLNPMQYLKGKGYPDGAYLFDIVSGGAFSGAFSQIEVWKDETPLPLRDTARLLMILINGLMLSLQTRIQALTGIIMYL